MRCFLSCLVFLLFFNNVTEGFKPKQPHFLEIDFKAYGLSAYQDQVMMHDKNNLFSFHPNTNQFIGMSFGNIGDVFSIQRYQDSFFLLRDQDVVWLKDNILYPIKTNENYSKIKLIEEKLYIFSYEDCIIDVFNILTHSLTTIDLDRRPVDCCINPKTQDLLILADECCENSSYLIQVNGPCYENVKEFFLDRETPYDMCGHYLDVHKDNLYILLDKKIKIFDLNTIDIIKQIQFDTHNYIYSQEIFIKNGILYCSYRSRVNINSITPISEDEGESDTEYDDLSDSDMDISESNSVEPLLQPVPIPTKILPDFSDHFINRTIIDLIDLDQDKHIQRLILDGISHEMVLSETKILVRFENKVLILPQHIKPHQILSSQSQNILRLNIPNLNPPHLEKSDYIKMLRKIENEMNQYREEWQPTISLRHLFEREITRRSLYAPQYDRFKIALIISKFVNCIHYGQFEKAQKYLSFLACEGYHKDVLALHLSQMNALSHEERLDYLVHSEGSILDAYRNEKRIAFLDLFQQEACNPGSGLDARMSAHFRKNQKNIDNYQYELSKMAEICDASFMPHLKHCLFNPYFASCS